MYVRKELPKTEELLQYGGRWRRFKISSKLVHMARA